ncbi:MAG TPA: D-alanine--D-alanine ligase family protein [Aeromicrobium sp.]|nr:D-alanine--D-alanine ligase family protein [Aeromicrobium sp.]
MTGGERPLRVAVVFGGQSSESGVSCLTARSVMANMDPARYDVTPVGITTDGRWVIEPGDWTDIPPGELPFVRPDGEPFAWERLRDFDVVFPLLHGPWGEDGTVQGLFEMAGVRYVGAGVLASAVAMDKPFTKALLASVGLPQVPYVTVTPRQWATERDRVLDRIQALRLPVFVKPARAGSSSGVAKVDAWDGLEAAIVAAQEFDPKVLVEAAIADKREVECGVLQQPDGTCVPSVVGEIRTDTSHVFYDFESKYLDGTSANLVPADIPEPVADRIREYAVKAFEAVGAEGFARVDFFLTGDDVVVNEINTIPGFTSFSMFPLLWEASGMSYGELIDHLITLAAERPLGLR